MYCLTASLDLHNRASNATQKECHTVLVGIVTACSHALSNGTMLPTRGEPSVLILTVQLGMRRPHLC